jgi:hypothetical protein
MAAGTPGTGDPRLQLAQPGTRTYLLLFVLAVLLPTGLGAVLPWLAGENASPLATAGILLAVTLAAYAGIVLLMRRHRFEMDAGGILVATTFYTRRLRWDQLGPGEPRVVDIEERTGLRPMLKVNGTSLPGFRSGWFRSRDLDRQLVATAGGTRLLWVPTREGYELLLQPTNPAAALECMKAFAAAAAAAVAPDRRAR